MKKGFTLIELVMIIVILGILAAVAIPKYFDLQNQAKQAAEKGVVGGVRAGIYTYFANWKAFPTTLDNEAAGTDASKDHPFFDNVLTEPVVADWKKGTNVNEYQGPTGTKYFYNHPNADFARFEEE